jgi:[protein-PII] uridylyltransferase
LRIGSAKISTFGEEVVDVFYVKDIFGMKVEHEGKLKATRMALLEALQEGSCEPRVAKPRPPKSAVAAE